LKIVMVGAGYVGLVTGACFSEFGVDVVCVDNDQDKIARLKQGEIPIYEPGLEDLVRANMNAGRLTFSGDLSACVAGADAVFIAVGTPPSPGNGQADLSYIFDVAGQIADALDGYTVVVTKSTVPVGTGREVARIIRERSPKASFDVCSNPEFLREGSAISDFMRPDRIVVGAESEAARDVMRRLYSPLFLIETPVLFTSLETAELIKYAGNSFLATKITFINGMADLCEKVGADVHDVARGIGLDGRIGRKFLHAGPGYGGSCFPKDTIALVRTAQEYGAPQPIVEAVVEANNARKLAMIDKIINACGGSVSGKTIAVLGVTFKPNTDDMRNAPSLVILPALIAAGATVAAFDPAGMAQGAKEIEGVEWCNDAYSAMTGADALVILTEWNEFRALDLARVKQIMAAPVVIDLRNVYDPDSMERAGFQYVCVGRGTKPKDL